MKIRYFERIFSFVCLVLSFATFVVGENEIPAYSTNEQRALYKFRAMVKDVLYREYMKEDYYLITWLRAKNLDLNEAAMMIRDAHRWRIENEMDTILEQPDELIKKLPYRSEGFDREGRPIIEMETGRWDVRRIVLSGQIDRYNMHINRMMEGGCARARNTGRKNVTQFVSLANLSGYSIRQHGCLACIPAHIKTITDYESYYPDAVKSIYMVNTPRVFQGLFQLITPFMSEASRRALTLFGLDTDEWRTELLKHIAADQMTINFGGTRH